MHSYHLYTYTIDIQPKKRVLISQSFGLAHAMGRRLSRTRTRQACHAPRALDTGAHNSEKRYDRPRVLMHTYHLYTYTIDIQPENRVLISQSFGLAHAMGRRLTCSHTRTRQVRHGCSIPERTTLKKDITDPVF